MSSLRWSEGGTKSFPRRRGPFFSAPSFCIFVLFFFCIGAASHLIVVGLRLLGVGGVSDRDVSFVYLLQQSGATSSNQLCPN